MKIKKEYIILIIIAAAAVIYLAVNKTGRMNYKIPELSKIESNDIDRITIQTPDSNIELTATDDSWIISPENYKADRLKVNSMISDLKDITLVDMVSESENYSSYGLDETSLIKVLFYNGNKVLRDISLGKQTKSYRYTFVRIPDDPRIYTVQGNISRDFNYNTDQLIDRQVLSFNSDDVEIITLEKGNHSIVMEKSTADDGTSKWKSKDGNEADSETINEDLKALSILKCMSFLDTEPENELMTLSMLSDKLHTLTIYKKTEKGYPAKSSDVDDPFILPEDIGSRMLENF